MYFYKSQVWWFNREDDDFGGRERSNFNRINSPLQSTTNNFMKSPSPVDLSIFNIFNDFDDNIVEIFEAPNTKHHSSNNTTSSNHIDKPDKNVCAMCNKKYFE